MGKAAALSTSPAATATPAWANCWLEVSPQRVKRRERRQRGGLCAQDARAERGLHKARRFESSLLFRGESRLWPRGQGGFAFQSDGFKARSPRRQQQARLRIGHAL